MNNKKLRAIYYFLISVFLFGAVSASVSAATFTVNRADDAGDGVCDATCTLRDAVIAANANQSADDDIINFTSSLSAITLNNEIAIDQSAGRLFINGLGADRLTINGGAGANRIFYTFLSNASGTEFHIKDVTLTGGNGGGGVANGEGGAIYANAPLLKLIRVHITGNSATSGGGVGYNSVGLYISESTFSNNNAIGNCGGIFNRGDGLLIVNSTISGNTAGGDGGGFCSSANSGNLNFVTVTSNTAFRGGGIAQDILNGTLNVGNSIIAGNNFLTGGNSSEIYRNNSMTMFVSDGFNLIGDNAGNSADTGFPIIYQPTDILDTPPQLIALGNFGGTTPTHAIQFNSPAKDAGDSASTLEFDQRGFDREPNEADIGAFEIQGNNLRYVTQTADANGVCDGNCSLREAIAAVPVGGRIEFAPGFTSSTPIIVNSEIFIDKNITIAGYGADKIVISTDITNHRIFFANTLFLSISGVTLTGGSADNGGAIYVNGGSLTVDRVHFNNNVGTGRGGGIYFLWGFNHLIQNSTFSENGGGQGGGFACSGEGNSNIPQVTVVNSTFALNLGGMNGQAFASIQCNIIARNITVSGNTGLNNGGIFITSNGTLNIGNSIVSGNIGITTNPVFLRPEISLFLGGSVTSVGNNLIGDSPGDAANTGSPITYQNTDILNVPPLLGMLNMNGGATPTLALLAGSPAINNGDNAKAVNGLNSSPLRTDQRGFLRIIGSAPPVVDIGAFEFGSAANWSAATTVGSNVNVSLGPVTVNFSDISTVGNTNVNPIAPTSAGSLPNGFSFGAGLPAFEITTTANFTPPITVCVQAPFVTNPTDFAALTLFHGENGVLVDRTVSRNFATKTICASVTSLSPFVVAVNLAPTAAQVSVGGQVLTANGNGIRNARVLLTNQNGETRTAMTNAFGYFRFEDVAVGETYIFSVVSKRFQFSDGTRILFITEEISDMVFVADW